MRCLTTRTTLLTSPHPLSVHGPAVSFNRGRPFLPFEQLLAVLPSASSQLLPEPFRWLMTDPRSPIPDFYPTKFQVGERGGSERVCGARGLTARGWWMFPSPQRGLQGRVPPPASLVSACVCATLDDVHTPTTTHFGIERCHDRGKPLQSVPTAVLPIYPPCCRWTWRVSVLSGRGWC